MASVWLERKGLPAKKLGGNLHPTDAIKLYHHQVSKWSGHVCECPGISFHAMLHHKTPKGDEAAGGPWGLLYVEFNSPPSKAEPGQPKHPKAQAGK